MRRRHPRPADRSRTGVAGPTPGTDRRAAGRLAASAALAITLGACTDNATRLAIGVDRVGRRLEDGPAGTREVFRYCPEADREAPYHLIFLPRREVVAAELVAAGLPRAVADDVFRQLGYVEVWRGSLIVVVQEGERLNFTAVGTQFNGYGSPLVFAGQGCRDLLLEKDDFVAIRGLLP